MPAPVQHALESTAKILEIIGAGALVLGFVVATVLWLRQAMREGTVPAYHAYRRSLGRVVLIGLEILVAATIIKTVTVAPTPRALGLLAVMIAIRTVLGWAMVLEVTGRWPWQRAPAPEPEP